MRQVANSNENLGWVVFFDTSILQSQIQQIMEGERARSIFPNSRVEEISNLIPNFFKERLDELEKMLPPGCTVISDQLDYILGRCCIIGPDDACVKLKEKVEVDGFAEMRRNVGIV